MDPLRQITVVHNQGSSALAKLSSLGEDLVSKLRMSRLTPDGRILQKEDVVDNQGFLTPVGAMAYLDYLWQNDVEAHKVIAGDLRRLKKEAKEDKK